MPLISHLPTQMKTHWSELAVSLYQELPTKLKISANSDAFYNISTKLKPPSAFIIASLVIEKSASWKFMAPQPLMNEHHHFHLPYHKCVLLQR